MIKNFLFIISLIFLKTGCTVDSAKNHYIFAEKLWSDKQYAASVVEFNKVIAKAPKGNLKSQATYRAAVTQFLFLKNYNEAIQLFKNYIALSDDKKIAWNAQLQIGEIFYHHIGSYKQASDHYQLLLSQNPSSSEASEFLFRIAKSHFFLFNFEESIRFFEELIRKYPKSLNAEKAHYEIGMVYFTEDDDSSYKKAIFWFENFLKKYPKSELVSDARFGIASCLEELNRLDEALRAYSDLKDSYVAPQVIQIKLNRIKERLIKQGKSY